MFGMDSEADYWDLVRAYTQRLAIRPGESVFESGCGTGAFLQAVQQLYGTSVQPLRLAGIDFSRKALKVAKLALDHSSQGHDYRSRHSLLYGMVQNLTAVPSNMYDVVLSFSVFGYLPSELDAAQAAKEMLRVAKPGGRVFIGNVNDAAKLGYADCMGTQRSFFSKDFWFKFSAKHRSLIHTMDIVDGYDIWHKTMGYDMAARFRYSIYFQKQ